MKKVIYTLFAGMFFLASCGPSAEEQAKEAQRIADSTAAATAAQVEARMQDSLAQVQALAAQEAQRIADSTAAAAMADSIAKASKKKAPAPKKLIKQDEAPKTAKPAQGRG